MSTWRPLSEAPSGRGGDTRRVSELLDSVTRRLGAPRAGVASSVFSRWEDLVGSGVAAHTKPVSLHDGLLVVAVDDPAWAAQLRYMTVDLLAKIAECIGAGSVRELRLRVGSGEPPRKSSRWGSGRRR
ncbi:MAG: DciA family protein [Acidimicrobiales bacterium]